MLFRRIDQHVRDQNWFAVLIDFCIVVIGVFIGIQVANWNEARADAILEREVLASLLDDLRADQASLSRSSDVAALGIDAGNTLLLEAGLQPVETLSFPAASIVLTSDRIDIEMPSAPTDTNPGDLWKHATVRIYPSQNSATIESLIAAGNASILKNASLVRDLLQYRTVWTGLSAAQVTTFRPIRDRTIFVGQAYDLSPFTPVDPEALQGALKESPELRSALRTMLEYTVAQRSMFDRIQLEAAALAERVEAELAR